MRLLGQLHLLGTVVVMASPDVASSLHVGPTLSHNPCSASDARLRHLQAVVCRSLGSVCAENVTAEGDWPDQVIYMHSMLRALTNATTCLNTTAAKSVLRWLDVTDPKASMWWYTWLIFQPQYFDMPRKPGTRIESAATLGRKCWAFAYMSQIWPPLKAPLANLGLWRFVDAYDRAVPITMELCRRVTANCYINATYDRTRNGTCPEKVREFVVGFEWENSGGGRGPLPLESVAYPFPRYSRAEDFDSFRTAVTLALNTTLNYIL